MQVITMQEFNANQKKYFELAENEVVYVAWKDARLMLFVPQAMKTNSRRRNGIPSREGSMTLKTAERTACAKGKA